MSAVRRVAKGIGLAVGLFLMFGFTATGMRDLITAPVGFALGTLVFAAVPGVLTYYGRPSVRWRRWVIGLAGLAALMGLITGVVTEIGARP